MLAVLTLLAACASGRESNPSPEPTLLEGPAGRVLTPIPAAPEWRSPSEPINRANVAQTQLLGRLDVRGTPSTLFDYALSPDSTQFAALNADSVVIWDLISGERIFTDARREGAYVFFSPDKTELFSITGDGSAHIYNLENRSSPTTIEVLNRFSGAHDYIEEEALLALGSLDGSIRVWDMLEERSLVTFDAHDRDIVRLVFSPDGQYLASAASAGAVKIWDWRAREVVSELDNGDAVVRRIAWSPDGERLAVASIEGIFLWNVPDASYLFTLQTGIGGSDDVLKYSQDGQFLINGGDIRDMIVWDAETGDLVALLPNVGGDVTSAYFSQDSEILLASVLDGPVTVWDMTQITSDSVVTATLDVGSQRVRDVIFAPDSYTMLFLDAIGPVYVWGIPPAESE